MPSIIERMTTAITDTTRPKMYRDPVINAGTLALFDFLDGYCNPVADGNIANGAVFKNLVPGGADGAAEINGPGNTFISNAVGKAGLVFSGVGSGVINRINLGLAAAYNLNTSQHEFIFCTWSKEPTTGYSTGEALIAGKLTAGNNAIYDTNVGAGGISKAYVAGGTLLSPATNAGLGSPRHVALHWKNGQQRLYVNNVLAASAVATTALPDHSAAPLQIGSSYTKMTFYRMLLEDIAVSGADPAAQIAADYARGVGRFV